MAAQFPVQQGTGFWRIERPDGARRTWLISPDGQPTFLLGVNTVMRDTSVGGLPRCAGIGDYIRRTDPTTAANVEWARLSTGTSGGHTVPRPYRFNSVGAFSQINDFDDTGGDSYMVRSPARGGAGAPYMVVLDVKPRGADRALKDPDGTPLHGGFVGQMTGDPFNPAFLRDLDAVVEREVLPRRADPLLQMWFAGNEIGIFDTAQHRGAGVRDFRRWIWSDVPTGSTPNRPLCARHALVGFLRERYRDRIEDLNEVWQTRHTGFAEIATSDLRADSPDDVGRFAQERLLSEWVRAITTRVRAADPNHLVGSPRMAIASDRQYHFWGPQDRWSDDPDEPISATSPFGLLGGFDVVAINGYTGRQRFNEPWFGDGLAKIHEESGRPLIVSEFGVRSRIDGWSNRGGAGSFVPGSNNQRERGRRYRSQIEQFASAPHVVGAVWHAWSDRYHADNERLQINMGLVQCADPARGMRSGERWDSFDKYVADTNHAVPDRIASLTGF